MFRGYSQPGALETTPRVAQGAPWPMACIRVLRAISMYLCFFGNWVVFEFWRLYFWRYSSAWWFGSEKFDAEASSKVGMRRRCLGHTRVAEVGACGTRD